MTKILLDAEAFKALSSDTRLQILKALDVRRLTVSELGRLLSLNKATVFEHLKQLAAAELVKKDEDGLRKWVYYRLSWKGRSVVHPENAQFMLMLGTAAVSLGGLVGALGWLLRWWGPGTTAGDTSELAPLAPDETRHDPQSAGAADPSGTTTPVPSEPLTARKDSDELSPPAGEPSDWWEDPTVWIMAALAVLLVAVAFLAGRLWLQRRAERLEVRRRLITLPGDVNEQEPYRPEAAKS